MMTSYKSIKNETNMHHEISDSSVSMAYKHTENILYERWLEVVGAKIYKPQKMSLVWEWLYSLLLMHSYKSLTKLGKYVLDRPNQVFIFRIMLNYITVNN